MSKILTRRNFIKAGIIGAAALAGAGTLHYCTRPEPQNKAGLVQKLGLSADYDVINKVDYPIALAGHPQEASFLLREKGRLFKNSDKLGVYVADNSGARRVMELPVSPYDLMPQGAFAIGQGDNRYDCLNLTGFNVEVRKTNLKSKLSSLAYNAQGGQTDILAAYGDSVFLKDYATQEFLLSNNKQTAKIRIPKGDELKNVEKYLRANSPPKFNELINDYLAREKARQEISKEFERLNSKPTNLIFTPSGITSNYDSFFGIIMDHGDYYLVSKKIKGDKK